VHSLHTRSRAFPRYNAAGILRRYGAPFAAVAATTSFALSPFSPYPFLQPVHNDAPDRSSAWSRYAPTLLGGEETKDSSITAKDAKQKVDDTQGGNQAPPPQTRIAEEDKDGEAKSEDKSGPWQSFTSSLSTASTSFSSLGDTASTSFSSLGDTASTSFSSLGDTIVDYVVPKWARLLPAYITKIQNELSMAPGSLAEEIWHEANDPESNPEITWDASVRVSNELCEEEKRFREKRQLFTKSALARYLDIPEDKIHADDVPVIAMCGSGGGLRALVAGTSSYLSAQEHGLFDCVTYTAGVSGSCWLQALYYSNISGRDHRRLIRHLKNRLGVHIAFPPDALELVASAPTNKYLLNGLVEKAKGIPDAEFGIVDIYGLLLAARLLVPKGELSVDEYDFKISNQRRYTDDGSHPMPIYTAVRHEIPLAEQIAKDPITAERKAIKEAWFQWFE
jgi:phospholipase A2